MTIKRSTVTLIAAIATVTVLGQCALAQTPAISTRVDVAYVSKYIWRGIPQTTDGAFQPSLTLTHSKGLSFNYWASYDTDKSDFTENDYTLNYSWSGGKVAMNAGCIYYAFPNTSYPSTSEVYVSAGLNCPLSPTLAVNCDIDEAEGFYASLGASHSLPLGNGSNSLLLSGRIGLSSSDYNSYWFGEDSTALSDLYLSASVPFTVGKTTLTPSLSYTKLLSSKLKDSPNMIGLDSSHLVGGMSVSMSF